MCGVLPFATVQFRRYILLICEGDIVKKMKKLRKFKWFLKLVWRQAPLNTGRIDIALAWELGGILA